MSDRELLELAAKAAGLSVIPYTWNKGTGWDHDGFTLAGCGGEEWNPLEDDGDALRLAVALGLRLKLPKYKGFGTSAEPQTGSTAGCTAFRNDPMEQTREAIVRAAAEIGRAAPAASHDTLKGETNAG